MKKILIVGQSFVTENNNSYGEQLEKEYSENITLKGIPAGGNDVITHIVMSNVENYDAFIINWSPTCGYDLHYTEPQKIKLHKPYGTTVDDKFWLCSGGWRGGWLNSSAGPLFNALYKIHFDVEDSWRRTLTNIVTIHQTLLNLNKEHLNLFSYDTFECVSFGAYEKNIKKTYDKNKWEKFKDRNTWTKLIDWEKIWFHQNELTKTGGVMDWCHDNTNDIGHHPSKESHTKFLNEIIQPWINKINE